MTSGELLAGQLAETRNWTLKILDDFADEDWSHQPAPGMGHAIWLCGHIAVAQYLLVHQRCFNRQFLDPAFLGHFPIGAPVKSVAEHEYPGIDDILQMMADIHARTLDTVRAATDEVLAEPAFGQDGAEHPHYRDKLGAISHCDRHEAFHAGQLASIRRLRGKTFLR